MMKKVFLVVLLLMVLFNAIPVSYSATASVSQLQKQIQLLLKEKKEAFALATHFKANNKVLSASLIKFKKQAKDLQTEITDVRSSYQQTQNVLLGSLELQYAKILAADERAKEMGFQDVSDMTNQYAYQKSLFDANVSYDTARSIYNALIQQVLKENLLETVVLQELYLKRNKALISGNSIELNSAITQLSSFEKQTITKWKGILKTKALTATIQSDSKTQAILLNLIDQLSITSVTDTTQTIYLTY